MAGAGSDDRGISGVIERGTDTGFGKEYDDDLDSGAGWAGVMLSTEWRSGGTANPFNGIGADECG